MPVRAAACGALADRSRAGAIDRWFGIFRDVDRFTVHEDFPDLEPGVEKQQIGTLPNGQASDLVLQSDDRCRRERGHAHRGRQVEADLLVHVPHHEVHPADAARQVGGVGQQADAAVAVKRLAAVERSERVHARRLIQGAAAVGDQRRPVRAFDRRHEPQQLGREVTPVRDDLGRHVGGREHELEHAGLHRRAAALPQRGHAAHRAVQMIDVPQAELVCRGHLGPRGVRMAGVQPDPLRSGRPVEIRRAWQLRRAGRRQHHVGELEVLLGTRPVSAGAPDPWDGIPPCLR